MAFLGLRIIGVSMLVESRPAKNRKWRTQSQAIVH